MNLLGYQNPTARQVMMFGLVWIAIFVVTLFVLIALTRKKTRFWLGVRYVLSGFASAALAGGLGVFLILAADRM